MDLQVLGESETRFRAYVDALSSVIGHADRKRPLEDYCVGLMGPSERKSVEPIAAVTAPARTAAQHQSLLHFIGESNWSDEKVLAKVREMVLPAIERHGAIEAWIVDDTGFPKKGTHSVGWRRNIAGSLAAKAIAKWRCRCRWPTITPACRLPIGCICRANGPRTANAVAKPPFQRQSTS